MRVLIASDMEGVAGISSGPTELAVAPAGAGRGANGQRSGE